MATLDPETMNSHDVGRGRGGAGAALSGLVDAGTRLTGLGIVDDALYAPRRCPRAAPGPDGPVAASSCA